MESLERLKQKEFLTIREHVNHKDGEVVAGNFFSFAGFWHIRKKMDVVVK